MTVREVIEALQKAKNPDALITITDTHGSFSEHLFTIDEDEDGEEVHIVVEYLG
jgi:hypothetical protein